MSEQPLFGLKPQITQALCDVLRQFPQVGRAVVYGSRALGKHKPGSDIDLTLYPSPGQVLQPCDVADIAEAIDELLLPYQVDLSAYDLIDHPDLRQHIDRVGRVLYAR